MRFHELIGVHRFFGPICGISFLARMSFIFMHFFVAILNNSFEDIKSNTDEQSKEFEMADSIVERMCDMLGISKQGNATKFPQPVVLSVFMAHSSFPSILSFDSS